MKASDGRLEKLLKWRVGHLQPALSDNPTNEMVRRLIPHQLSGDRGGSFYKEDHRHADTFSWHRSG